MSTPDKLDRCGFQIRSSPDKFTYENKIAERFGGQKELELIVPTPSVIPVSAEEVDLIEQVKKIAWTKEDDEATSGK